VSIKRLEALFTANSTQAITEIEKLAATTEARTASMGEKFAAFGKTVALVGVVAGAAIAGMSVKIAGEFENAHANLLVALKNHNQAWSSASSVVAQATATGAKFGHNAVEIEQQLARGVGATGSATKAYGLLKVAMDLSAFAHKDLATSMLAVIKASEGQLRPLKMLGVDVPLASGGALKLAQAHDKVTVAYGNVLAAALKLHDAHKQTPALHDAVTKATEKLAAAQAHLTVVQGTGAQMVAALTKVTGGAAAAAAETFHGQLKTMVATVENLGIKIGMFLIPILQKVMTVIMGVVDWLGKHKTIAYALAIVIGGVLVAAVVAWTVSLFAAGGALAFLMSPITLIVAGIALLVAGVLWLWNNWNQVWKWIKDNPALAAVIGVVLAVVAPIVLVAIAAVALGKHWKEIWTGIQQVLEAAWKVIKPVVDTITGALHLVAGALETVANALGSGSGAQLDAWIAKHQLATSAVTGLGVAVGTLGTSINNLPLAKASTITADTSAANYKLDALRNRLANLSTTKSWAGVGVASIFGALTGLGGMIGSFDTGGVVPGPIGMAQLAVVHSGETIIPTHKAGVGLAPMQVVINVTAGPTSDLGRVGEEIIKSIQMAERRLGTSWRAGAHL